MAAVKFSKMAGHTLDGESKVGDEVKESMWNRAMRALYASACGANDMFCTCLGCLKHDSVKAMVSCSSCSEMFHPSCMPSGTDTMCKHCLHKNATATIAVTTNGSCDTDVADIPMLEQTPSGRRQLAHSAMANPKRRKLARFINRWRCTKCSFASYQNSLLTTHMRHAHSSERPYVCELCNKGFKTKSCLERHRERVRGGYQCSLYASTRFGPAGF